jgi:hypothetical protein
VYCLACKRDIANAHYRKRRAAQGKPVREPDLSPQGYKRCAECRTVKSVDDFHKTKRTIDGLAVYCKPCRKARGRADHLQQTYGLTEADLGQMLTEQDGLCAVCKRRPAEHVDHDHVFGVVRGVLCFPCNAALGQFQDDIPTLLNAIDYLERTTWQRTLVCTGVYRLRSPRPGPAASATS